MRKIFVLSLIFAVFLGVQPAPAHALGTAQNYIQPLYLPPQLLPPPPVEGSAGWHADLDAVLKAQRGLSPHELAAIRDEQKLRLELMTSVMGAGFTRDRLPKTFALLDQVLNGASQVVEADKKFWHTRRPYLNDSRVKLYVDPIDQSPAYPSGHTAESRVLAEVLGMLEPGKIGALRARAAAIARHRVEAGVHYPSDLEGGRLLAMLIVGSLTADDNFQDDLAAARKEIAIP